MCPLRPRRRVIESSGPSSNVPGRGTGYTCLALYKRWIFSYKRIRRPCLPSSESPRGLCGHITAVCALGWGSQRPYQSSVLQDGTLHPSVIPPMKGEAPENQLGSPGGPWLHPTLQGPQSIQAGHRVPLTGLINSRFVSHASGSWTSKAGASLGRLREGPVSPCGTEAEGTLRVSSVRTLIPFTSTSSS